MKIYINAQFISISEVTALQEQIIKYQVSKSYMNKE